MRRSSGHRVSAPAFFPPGLNPRRLRLSRLNPVPSHPPTHPPTRQEHLLVKEVPVLLDVRRLKEGATKAREAFDRYAVRGLSVCLSKMGVVAKSP